MDSHYDAWAASEAWDRAHPGFWEQVLQFTFELIRAGNKNGGIAQVFERIRWETRTGNREGGDFKADNIVRAYYSRRFHLEFPDHKGFFRTRRSILDGNTV